MQVSRLKAAVLFCSVLSQSVLFCFMLFCDTQWRTVLWVDDRNVDCNNDSPALRGKEKDRASLLSLTAIGVTSACTVTVLWYCPFTTQENVDLCFPSTLLQNIISNPAQCDRIFYVSMNQDLGRAIWCSFKCEYIWGISDSDLTGYSGTSRYNLNQRFRQIEIISETWGRERYRWWEIVF